MGENARIGIVYRGKGNWDPVLRTTRTRSGKFYAVFDVDGEVYPIFARAVESLVIRYNSEGKEIKENDVEDQLSVLNDLMQSLRSAKEASRG